MRNSSIFSTTLVAALALTLSSAKAQVKYQVTALSNPLESSCQAVGLNDSGQVIGLEIGTERGWLWQNGSRTYLPTLPAGYSTASTVPYSINSSGAIACKSRVSQGYAASVFQGGSLAALPSLGGTSSGGAYGINDSGLIVGGSLRKGEGYESAALWTNGVASDLTTYSGSALGYGYYCQDINNRGLALGGYYGGNYSTTDHPIYFDTVTRTMVNLPQLATSHGNVNTRGVSLNDSGSYTGYASAELNGNQHAVAYVDGSTIDLGLLSSTYASYGTAINNSNQVVGYSMGSKDKAFLWQGGQMLDLNNLLDSSATASGWQLSRALGINNLGQIVGYGYLPGYFRAVAFLATPVTATPEPGTIAVLGLSALAMVRRRRA